MEVIRSFPLQWLDTKCGIFKSSLLAQCSAHRSQWELSSTSAKRLWKSYSQGLETTAWAPCLLGVNKQKHGEGSTGSLNQPTFWPACWWRECFPGTVAPNKHAARSRKISYVTEVISPFMLTHHKPLISKGTGSGASQSPRTNLLAGHSLGQGVPALNARHGGGRARSDLPSPLCCSGPLQGPPLSGGIFFLRIAKAFEALPP